MSDLAVIILTHNEEKHLDRCLAALDGLARDVFVVDSFSTDRTVEIARSRGANVLQNRFINYAQQFRWALENAPVTAEWVMRLDADEVVEPDLAAEMKAKLPALPADVTGINLKRKHIFLGRWIRHGGRFPLVLLRVWRRGAAQIEERWMDEHMVLDQGRAVTFDGGFADHNLNDLTFFTDKHNKYATREAIDVILARRNILGSHESLSAAQTSFQASVRRWLKKSVYNRLPFFLSSTLYFSYRYVVQLGFLDGKEGLIYHVLQGCWYRFLVGAKIVELERALAGTSGRDDVIRELSRLTGFDVAGVVRSSKEAGAHDLVTDSASKP